MKSVRIVFLDVDGVLNTDGMFVEHGPRWRTMPVYARFREQLDSALVERLLDAVKRFDAQVVLSSTWRTSPAACLAIKHAGIDFIGQTPSDMEAIEGLGWPQRRMFSSIPRAVEIHAWLAQSAVVRNADVSFVVFDDNPIVDVDYSRNDATWYVGRCLVQTDPRVGLTDDNVIDAERIFGLHETSEDNPA